MVLLLDMPSPRHSHMTAVLTENRIMCVGGRDAEATDYMETVVAFDFTTNAWASPPDMPSPRTCHGAEMSPGSEPVCAGGKATPLHDLPF